MRNSIVLFTSLAVLAFSALALEGQSGWTATESFSASDAVSGMQYPAGFSGVYWDDPAITRFDLAMSVNAPSEFLAADSAGTLYFVVHGATTAGETRYKGLALYDGTSFKHLVQDDLTPLGGGVYKGSRVVSVVVSPTTTGALTADHPVIVREVYPDGGGTASDRTTEIWSVDPTSSPATQTLVRELTGGLGEHAVIDADGAVYVFDMGTVRKLTFSGASYDESILVTGLGQEGITLGPDGALYAFASGAGWGLRKGTNDVVRVDPATGSTSVHAAVSRKFGGLVSWTWDSNGALWLVLKDGSVEVVAELPAGGTLSTKRANVIAETANGLARTIAAGPTGELFVAEWSSVLAGAETLVFELVDTGSGGGGDDGDGGSGGGGKGGGKGKPK